jgi:hypothetical protein
LGLCQAPIEKNIQIFPLDCAADLVNVWAYVEAYPDEIDSAIRGQDEADEILYTPENKPMARILCRRTLSPTSRPGI